MIEQTNCSRIGGGKLGAIVKHVQKISIVVHLTEVAMLIKLNCLSYKVILILDYELIYEQLNLDVNLIVLTSMFSLVRLQ